MQTRKNQVLFGSGLKKSRSRFWMKFASSDYFDQVAAMSNQIFDDIVNH